MLAERKIGNTLLASGHLNGFGTADFDPEYLKAQLLRPLEPRARMTFAGGDRPGVAQKAGSAEHVREWAFIESAIAARKPGTYHPDEWAGGNGSHLHNQAAR